MFYVIKKVGFFRRVWHQILTHIFKREVTVYTADSLNEYRLEMTPHFLCPGCDKYQDWAYGCADDHPEICDACWEKLKCPVCKAEPGQPCDGGLHG